MIRFGLRLVVTGGREAIARLVTIAAAVALGVGLLLATLAAVNAVNAQDTRYAWLNTGIVSSGTGPLGDPEWWLVRGDYYDRQQIGRIDVAGTGPDSPVPPGIPRLPGPGEFYASPALSALLASTPSTELGDRFGGHRVGTIGPAALPSPDSLVIVIGHTPDQLAAMPGAMRITRIANLTPGDCDGCEIGIRAAGLDLILSVVAGALLFPVLIFIGVATRLSAARREQRFAAMRLLGATPRQISVIAAVESTAASFAGTVLGFGLFFLLRGPLAAIPLTGAPFFPADLSLNLVDVLAVALGVPAGAAVAARLALRRVRISPLGVTRRAAPRPPRAYRLILLALGIGELAYFVGRVPDSSIGQVAAFLPGFLMIMAGLVVAGPWLTMVGARVLARRSSRPATLIAARRLADNPQAAFRAVSGMILALFVTSVAVGVITTIVAHRGAQRSGTAATTLTRQWPPMNRSQSKAGSTTQTPVPDSLTADLRSTPGVRSVTVIRANPDHSGAALQGVASCADIALDPALGRCAAGAAVAQVWSDFVAFDGPVAARRTWPTSPVSVEQFRQLPIESVAVNTDGSTRAIERARTIIESAYPGDAMPPSTDDDFGSDATSQLAGYKQLADVVILASLPIAGCSLAVSVVGGLSERKRPFSLLRLSGVPLRMLRRVVALESAVPLLVVAVVAIGVGLAGAQLFLRAQMGYTLRPLGTEYYLIVVAGLTASLGLIASTLPLLERITGPETARNE